MADVYCLRVIAIENRNSREGPSGHTNWRDSVFMRKDKSGYQTTVKLTYLHESGCTALGEIVGRIKKRSKLQRREVSK